MSIKTVGNCPVWKIKMIKKLRKSQISKILLKNTKNKNYCKENLLETNLMCIYRKKIKLIWKYFWLVV